MGLKRKMSLLPVSIKDSGKPVLFVINSLFFLEGKTFSSPPDVFLRKDVLEMQQIYRTIPTPKCDFNKVALQLLLKSYIGMGVLP